MTVVAVGQVDTDLLSDKHLETVHSLTGLGDIQLIVVRIAHIQSLLFVDSGKSALSGLESVFFFP